MLMETRIQVINSKGSFYAALNQRKRHTDSWAERGGCIPWAGGEISNEIRLPLLSLLPPTLRFKEKWDRGKERVAKVTFILHFSFPFTHTIYRHENIMFSETEDRHHFPWWWESCLISLCSGHVTNLWVAKALWIYPWEYFVAEGF